jgi:hypothetical protein
MQCIIRHCIRSLSSSSPRVIRRLDYKKPPYEVPSINITFDLLSLEEVKVENVLKVKYVGGEGEGESLFLHGHKDMHLESISSLGGTVKYERLEVR